MPILLALILIFAWRSCLTHSVFNDTADEEIHIACGLEVWQYGRYTIEPQHPPLARVILALPAYAGGLRLVNRRPSWFDYAPGFYWRTLSLARLGNLLFVPLLLAYVFLWGNEVYGRRAGLAAAALVALSPNLLAHASLATLDFGAATTMFLSAYYFWRWSLEEGLRRAVAAALFFGMAGLTKFSALFILPLIAAAFFLSARRLPERRSMAAFFPAVALTLWSGYAFRTGPLPPAQFLAPPGTRSEKLQLAVERIAGQASVPAPQFVRGVLDVIGHNAQGHQSYLLGRLSQHGWWYYFPVALGVKSTIPLLALSALGWVTARRAARPIATAALILLAICMASDINLGIRHILAIYPLMGLLAGAAFASSRKLVLAASLGLLVWHAVESIRAHPDYLAYFNQIARGREEDFLLDSALDWGQDLERLRRYLEENRIEAVYLSYFGRGDAIRERIRGAQELPPNLRPKGWVAVSKAHIAGLALQGYDLRWLRAYQPVAHIGESILVYYFK